MYRSLTATSWYIFKTSLTLLLICSLDLLPVCFAVCLGRCSNHIQNPLVALGFILSIGVLCKRWRWIYSDQLLNQYFLLKNVFGTMPLWGIVDTLPSNYLIHISISSSVVISFSLSFLLILPTISMYICLADANACALSLVRRLRNTGSFFLLFQMRKYHMPFVSPLLYIQASFTSGYISVLSW